MTRTTAALLALGSAVALAGCSSHSSSATPPPTTTGASSAPPSATPTSSAPSASTPPPVGAAPPTSTAPTTGAAPTTSAAATTSAGPTTAAGSTRCPNASLKVTLGSGEGAAGSTYTSIVFTNTGTDTCTLAGHPGVSYVAGDDGHQVGASAKRDPGTITTISLAPDKSAAALLREVDAENFDQAACKPVSVRGLRVYPPGSTASVFLARTGKACSATKLPSSTMSVGVVKPGTSAAS